MKEERPFPDWFMKDVDYYSNLGTHKVELTWGKHGDGVILSADKLSVSQPNAERDLLTYVLGNENFKDGVHTWNMQVDNVVSMWVGICRNIDLSDPLGKSGLDIPDRFMLLYPSNGDDALLLGSKGIQATKILNGFKSGDQIQILLDNYQHLLKIRINGVLAFTAMGIDDGGVQPVVIMDSGSATFIDTCLSRRQNPHPSILSIEDMAMGLDNYNWNTTAIETLASAAGSDCRSSIIMHWFFWCMIIRKAQKHMIDPSLSFVI